MSQAENETRRQRNRFFLMIIAAVAGIYAVWGVSLLVAPAHEEEPARPNDAIARIEADLEECPHAYTARIGTIHVVEDFVARFGPIGLFCGAYCEDERPEAYRHVFIKNKNLGEDLYGLVSMDVGTHLVHESCHSVEYWEIARHAEGILGGAVPNRENIFSDLKAVDAAAVAASLREPRRTAPSDPYIRLIRDWMFAHFGDVNGDGRLDEADADAVAANPERFDADGDGALTYADVARRTPYRYLYRTNPLDPVVQFAMTLEQFTGWCPAGFASVYGSNEPWEDRAEVLALVHRRGLLALLRAAGPAQDRAAKWLTRLRSRDAVLARKIDLMLNYLRALVPTA